MRVTVCIVGFRNPDDITGCLLALARSSHTNFEVVVCENGGQKSRDDLVDLLGEALPGGQRIEVLPYYGNLGYAGGNNRCIEARPAADLWWILNPDTRVAPDAMALLIAKLASRECDAVGGTLCHDDNRVQAYGGRWRPSLARAISIGSGTRYDPTAQIAAESPDYILGASLMFTRDFLDQAGPMREDYFLYGEEIEWCLRAASRGLRLGNEPNAVIQHSQGTTTGDGGAFSKRPRLPVFLDQRNKLLILRDSHASLPWLCALGSLGALLMRCTKHRAWRQLGYGLSGWVAGARNQRGTPPWLV